MRWKQKRGEETDLEKGDKCCIGTEGTSKFEQSATRIKMVEIRGGKCKERTWNVGDKLFRRDLEQRRYLYSKEPGTEVANVEKVFGRDWE